MIISPYSIEPENGGIGVFCHEFGHQLGATDLYDYGYDAAGLGTWSVMALGSWGGDYRHPERPSHFDPYHKALFGWVTPRRLKTDRSDLELPQVETHPIVYRLWKNGMAEDEYFLVENRQRYSFDSLLPGAGLLIYHVDESQWDNDYEWFPGKDPTQHYTVALEQADGRWDLEHNFNVGDAGDPWPGSTNTRAFSLASTPDSNAYLGGLSGAAVGGISDSAETMRADLLVIPQRRLTWHVRAEAAPDGNGTSSQKAFATIRQAMVVASHGDRILVGPGVYSETVAFAGKRVLLRSLGEQEGGGAARTILRAPATGPTVLFRHGETNASVLSGFTITHLSNMSGPGIRIQDCSPTIIGNIVANNTTTGGDSDTSYGGGIDVTGQACPILTDNRLVANAADYGAGLCIYGQEAGAVLRGNRFEGNRASKDGGGAAVMKGGGRCSFAGDLFIGNEARGGGGLYCDFSGPFVSGCRFESNAARNDGGAVLLDAGSYPQLRRLTIVNCSAFLYRDSSGGGIACLEGSSPAIRQLSLAGCSAPRGAGLWADEYSYPILASSIIAFCHGRGGVQSPHALRVEYCDLYDNEGGNYVGFTNPTGSKGNLAFNPLFADLAGGDLHLRSRIGRFDPQGERLGAGLAHQPLRGRRGPGGALGPGAGAERKPGEHGRRRQHRGGLQELRRRAARSLFPHRRRHQRGPPTGAEALLPRPGRRGEPGGQLLPRSRGHQSGGAGHPRPGTLPLAAARSGGPLPSRPAADRLTALQRRPSPRGSGGLTGASPTGWRLWRSPLPRSRSPPASARRRRPPPTVERRSR